MLDIEFKAGSALPQTIGSGADMLVVMPFIEPELARRSAQLLARRAGLKGLLYAVFDDRRAGFVAIANAVFRRAAAPCFGYVAQDAYAGRDWLKRGQLELSREDGGLLAFNDGKWDGSLAAFGLASRAWAINNYDGDLFMPSYRRHYADTELTLIAMQQRRLRYDAGAVLIEVDWTKEDQAVDAQDRATFKQRASTQYGGLVTDAVLLDLFH